MNLPNKEINVFCNISHDKFKELRLPLFVMSVTASCPVAMSTGLVASNTTYVSYPEVNEIYGFGVQRHFQQYFIYIVAVSFIGGRKPEYLDKTINLPQVTDTLYHIMLYIVHLA